MHLKIRCDGKSEKNCKIFWELNKARWPEIELFHSSVQQHYTSVWLWSRRSPMRCGYSSDFSLGYYPNWMAGTAAAISCRLVWLVGGASRGARTDQVAARRYCPVLCLCSTTHQCPVHGPCARSAFAAGKDGRFQIPARLETWTAGGNRTEPAAQLVPNPSKFFFFKKNKLYMCACRSFH